MANRLADEFDIHVAPETVYTATLATIDFMKADGKGKKVLVLTINLQKIELFLSL